MKKNFSNRTISQIRIWVWVAAVAPLSTLAVVFLVWLFGTKELFDDIMIVGGSTMVVVSVVWWWWVLYVIKILLRYWNATGDAMVEIEDEIKDIRELAKELLLPLNDK